MEKQKWYLCKNTVHITDEIHKRLKEVCENKGYVLHFLVNLILQDGIKKYEK